MARKARTYACAHCGKECRYDQNKTNIFCSNQCQQDYAFAVKFVAWMDGDAEAFKSNDTRRRAIIHRSGKKCATCGIWEWNGKPIVLEVEHRDGNFLNNHQSNLELNCPNCHSQTPTYKNRNKGNGRPYRRKAATTQA